MIKIFKKTEYEINIPQYNKAKYDKLTASIVVQWWFTW